MENGQRIINNTELIDLDGNCQLSLPDYPMLVDGGATGVYYNDEIVVCGGYLTNICYNLQRGWSSFEFFATMENKRYDATGYLTTEWGFCRPLCAKGMPVTYFFRI